MNDIRYGVTVSDGGNLYMINCDSKEEAIYTARIEYNRLGKNLGKNAILNVVAYDFDEAVKEHAEIRGIKLDEAEEEIMEFMKTNDFYPCDSIIENYEF